MTTTVTTPTKGFKGRDLREPFYFYGFFYLPAVLKACPLGVILLIVYALGSAVLKNEYKTGSLEVQINLGLIHGCMVANADCSDEWKRLDELFSFRVHTLGVSFVVFQALALFIGLGAMCMRFNKNPWPGPADGARLALLDVLWGMFPLALLICFIMGVKEDIKGAQLKTAVFNVTCGDDLVCQGKDISAEADCPNCNLRRDLDTNALLPHDITCNNPWKGEECLMETDMELTACGSGGVDCDVHVTWVFFFFVFVGFPFLVFFILFAFLAPPLWGLFKLLHWFGVTTETTLEI